MTTTAKDTTYNGWTNYETWAVGMFLDGNYTGEGDHLAARAIIEQAREDAPDDSNVSEGIWTVEETAKFRAADALKEFVEGSLPEPSGLAGDLVGAALSEVNWEELAENKFAE